MSSSSLTLYDITIPLLVRSLEQLQAFLKKGEQQWVQENKKDPQLLLDARLIDDMLPLPYQIQTVCNTAKNLLPRIAGEEAQPVEDNEKTFEELFARIESTIKILKTAKKEKFVEPTLKILIKSGKFEAEMEALHYIQRFCLPNFFFHLTTAYNILRKEGVQIGKMDWLGVGDLTTWSL